MTSVIRSLWRFSLAVPVLALVLHGGSAAEAKQLHVIDLARQDAGTTETRSIAAGELNVRIINMNRTFKYSVDMIVENIPVDPLPPSFKISTTDCASAESEVEAELAGKIERDVAQAVQKVRDAMPDCVAAVDLAGDMWTTRSLEATALVPGQRVVITVRRTDKSGSAAKEWTVILTTGKRGQWYTAYGFTFFPNEDEEHFTQQDPNDPTMFTIEEQDSDDGLEFAPSVMFSWIPASKVLRDWSHGPVAGLGFDLDSPILFGGYGGTFNHNVTFVGGVVIHQRTRLDGRYEVGQSLSESLDADQLDDETYGFNVFLGIAFRLGSNPFKAEDEKPQGTDGKEAK